MLYSESLYTPYAYPFIGSTLSPQKNEAQAFVPGHITGIFRIFDDCEDTLLCGSMGAGFSIQAGTLTRVVFKEDSRTDVSVEYNGRTIEAPVTGTVVRKMLQDYARQGVVNVSHRSDLPIGVGFGASGAGSLGTALALGSILDEKMTVITAGQYAHHAEVENRTGLGDVIAQTVGGIEVRKRPGAPGIGEVLRVPHTEDITVVLAGRTGIETKAILTDPASRERINSVGDKLLADLIETPSLDTILSCSQEFAKATGLMTRRVRMALNDLWTAGFNRSSMVMLGDSVFCMCDESDVGEVRQILTNHWSESEILLTTISEHGGGLT